jgi:hypothetical protein
MRNDGGGVRGVGSLVPIIIAHFGRSLFFFDCFYRGSVTVMAQGRKSFGMFCIATRGSAGNTG